MRHRVVGHTFGRKHTARKSLIKGLMASLVEHGRIKTTLAKAKEVRRHIEKAITLGKKGDLNSRRLLISRVGSEGAVQTIMGDLSKRFESRPGGYTRVLKMGLRPGDQAPMALIEFVDFKLPELDDQQEKSSEKSTEKKDKAQAKKVALAAKQAKVRAKKQAEKKKKIRKIQAKSRRINRTKK